MTAKELIVVAGPNGVGKTTFAEEYSSFRGIEFLSADQIAGEMGPGQSGRGEVAAGREYLRRIDAGIENSRSLVVESTLSGRTFRKVLKKARAAGFEITIVFLFLDSAETCLARVHERIQKGGHDVPERDVRRRFIRSLRNFWHLYRSLSDHWMLGYNAGPQLQDVAVGTAGEVSVSDAELFAQFQQSIDVEA